jgi:superfamily II RNA helicase
VFGEKVSAMRDDGEGTTFALERVNRIYRNIYNTRSKNIEEAFLDTFEGKNKPLDEPKLSFKKLATDEASMLIGDLIGSVSAKANSQSAIRNPQAETLLWECYPDAELLHRYTRDIDYLYSEIWQPFERRARVLDHFGYVDFASEKVTETGKWLADVRVDRPLLVGEALRRGIFDDLTPQIAAGLMASLAADSDRNYGELYLSDGLLDVISRLEDIIFDVSNAEWNAGIEPAEDINLSAAAAAEKWAEGMTWEQLARKTGAEEGDLFRLLARTGEALLQIANLRDSNAKAAAIARDTSDILLREPVR